MDVFKNYENHGFSIQEEKVIDWNFSAEDLHNKIRGMYQINTNHTTFNGKLIKVLKTEVTEKNQGNIGEIIEIEKDYITVKCSKNALKILLIKPEGKGEMKPSDWARGARINIGDKFEWFYQKELEAQ